jgi:predicted dithiol-disulfide oxidoreductase (DUF899 family)
MTLTFPNESAEYRAARDKLLEAEIALRRQMEAVSEQRRALPPGGEVTGDYRFEGLGDDGKPRSYGLADLFRPGTDQLLMYQMMFPRHANDDREPPEGGETAKLPLRETPCPSCTVLLDQLDAAAIPFEAAGSNFVVVAKAPLDRLLALARDRGWTSLRMLHADSDFKRAYHSEDEEGQQLPMTTVFQRAADGTVRHFWSSELTDAPADPGQDPRAQGTIEPFWNMLDLMPGGRPDFLEQMQYDCCDGAEPPTVEKAPVAVS